MPTLLIPAFVTLLAVSSVNVILPAVSQDLSAGTAGLQLVVSGYSLVFGVVLVPAVAPVTSWAEAGSSSSA